jgi:hypothetical protein
LANQSPTYEWNYELRGQDKVVFEWAPLVFTPSHCKPLYYDFDFI